MISWLVAGATVAFISTYCAYYVGYVRGYRAGIAYGVKGLEDYHQYALAGLRSLSNGQKET